MTSTERGARPPGADHVPVEHRWLGLDRRTIPSAAVVLGLMLIFMIGIPAIDQAVDWDDEIAAGDVLDLGAGVTLVPPVGWELYAGIRTDDEPTSGVSDSGTDTVVGTGGVTISVRRSGFDGTATDLLEQVNRLRTASNAEPNRAFKLTGPRATITTDAGLTGVSEDYTSASGSGRIVAFTVDAGASGTTATGVAVTIDGDDQALADNSAEIDALLNSITAEEAAP